MLISTFQLHNVVKKPVEELGLNPCCLALLRANNLLPFDLPDPGTPRPEPLRTEAVRTETLPAETPGKPSPGITPEANLGDFLRAFKELSKQAAPAGK